MVIIVLLTLMFCLVRDGLVYALRRGRPTGICFLWVGLPLFGLCFMLTWGGGVWIFYV